jgi:Holliday junction resolvasome RuvABC endonuclease subunit
MVNLGKMIPKPSKICAIDASTNSLAFSIFDEGKLVACGKISFTGKNIFDKVRDAARKTGKLFSNFDIDAIVIEHTVFLNSPKTMNDLAMVQGALLGSAGIRKVKTINPIAWQTFIGNGKLTKEEKLKIRNEVPGKSDAWYKSYEREFRKNRTINFVNINYDKQLIDNDVADAIGIGHYAVRNWEKLGD